MKNRSNSTKNGLLRFISRGLDVETLVSKQGSELFVQVKKDDELIGSRRLAKAKCCQSESPCIGTIPIPLAFQEKYQLPSFIHVSLCFGELLDSLNSKGQT